MTNEGGALRKSYVQENESLLSVVTTESNI